MRQTNGYSGSQYARDSGFPLVWMCHCCCTSRAASDAQAEVEEHYQRTKSKPGVIIGRPAGREAYTGRSAMQYKQQSSDVMVLEATGADKSQQKTTSQT